MTLAMQYKQTLKMQFFRNAGFFVVIAMMQIIISLGIAVGFTYLFSEPQQQSLLYLATGAPTIVLLMTGLVLLPVHITNNRSEGYDEFLRTLPVNRAAIFLADTTIWLLITLPGIIISMLVTNVMFAPGYAVSPWFFLAFLLCGLTCVGGRLWVCQCASPYIGNVIVTGDCICCFDVFACQLSHEPAACVSAGCSYNPAAGFNGKADAVLFGKGNL